MCLIYSALLAIVLVLGSPYWAYQMLRHGKYRRGLLQRFGVVPRQFRQPNNRCIWVHAVSVGEVLAVSELVQRLRSEFPNHRTVVSTTTDTGQKLAASRFGPENVFYFPLDFVLAVRPWIHALRPELVVIAETEFWPNFLRSARAAGAKIAVVNARISDRSLPGYLRWRRILTRVLRPVNLFLAQTPEDARRLTEIGAPGERVSVSGNLKYDVPLATTPPIVNELRASLTSSGAGPVLVCGSTVDGEEVLLVNSFRGVLARLPHAVMLLAPRHPQRFEEVGGLLNTIGIPWRRRSLWQGEPLGGTVLLIDSIGELASLYALADIAFVGGSLVPRGGHNILEPAQHGVPILVGPHTENFRHIVDLFRSRDAVRVVRPEELTPSFTKLIEDQQERKMLGKRAAEAQLSQRGAIDITLARLKVLLQPSSVNQHEAAPA